MGRPINKRYFGSTKAATAQNAQNPKVDGKDQAGNTLTDTALYSEKKLGYSIPVYSARVTNAGTAQTEVQVDPSVSEYPYIVKQTGSRTYLVRTSATASHVGRCKLVDKAAGTLAAGEMILQGNLGGDAGAGRGGLAVGGGSVPLALFCADWGERLGGGIFGPGGGGPAPGGDRRAIAMPDSQPGDASARRQF